MFQKEIGWRTRQLVACHYLSAYDRLSLTYFRMAVLYFVSFANANLKFVAYFLMLIVFLYDILEVVCISPRKINKVQ